MSTDSVEPKILGPDEDPHRSSAHAPEKEPHLIVAVGASAGEVETLREFLRQLRPAVKIGVVLILSTENVQSIVSRVLARDSRLPIVEVTHKMRVKPGAVHVIPADKDVTIKRGMFHLVARSAVPGRHTPIDDFMRALAADQGPKAVGVILSGADSDGTKGLTAIKAEGGVTFVQDPGTAAYSPLPRHPVDAKVVDFVLPIEGIVKELERLTKHRVANLLASATVEPVEISRDGFSKIVGLLKKRTGVDFRRYKDSTIKRRLLRRMVIAKLDTLDEYLQLLEENPAEIDALYQDILIMVTQFFRDPETFEIIKSEVFPHVARRKSGDEPWRFWTVGVSAGQEAYSLGIALFEFLEPVPQPPIQIFGSDVNESDIVRARAAIYPPAIASEMSEERLNRFFEETAAGYQVKKSLRELCIFAKHDVTRDPPFTRLDLITCRNVLIYFGAALQERLIPLFHYALRPSGFLVLGSSESVGKHTDLFELVDKKHKIYARKPGQGELPLEFGAPFRISGADEREHDPHLTPARKRIRSSFDLQREADKIVASTYAPVGVVVDDDYQVRHFRGETGHFLTHPAGAASLDVVAMAREGLREPLQEALGQAGKTKRAVNRTGVGIPGTGVGIPGTGVGIPAPLGLTIDLEVIPFASPTGEQFFHIVFREKDTRALGAETPQTAEGPPAEAEYLRKELSMTRERLQTMVRDKEAANEELRAAYEELQSSNEELHSINEELETAKEELQSINEELTTVNGELQLRNSELSRAHDDYANLLASVDIPILMLDSELRIRRFTEGVEQLLNVIPSDIGRPISDIQLQIDVPDLETLIRRSIHEVRTVEREVRVDRSGRWYSIRIRPHTTSDMRIEGAVVSFVDIHDLKINLERTEELAHLTEARNVVTGAIDSSLSLSQTIDKAMAPAANALGTPIALLLSQSGGQWIVEQAIGVPRELEGTRVEADEIEPALGARNRNYSLSRRLAKDDQSFLSKQGIRSTLATPLVVSEGRSVLLFGHPDRNVRFTPAQIDFADKLAETLSLAVENARLRQAEHQMAENMRRQLEPQVMPVPNIEVGYAWRVTSELERVGGDLLDVFPTRSDDLVVFVGDVAGHGLPAAAMTESVRTIVEALVDGQKSPARILSQVNSVLSARPEPTEIVTAALFRIDHTTGQVIMASAGHCNPIIGRGSAYVMRDTVHKPPLGALPDSDYHDEQFQLEPGDRLVVYTDGITEARYDGEFYGDDRMLAVLAAHSASDPQEQADTALADVLEFCGGKLRDDAVIGVIRLTGKPEQGVGVPAGRQKEVSGGSP